MIWLALGGACLFLLLGAAEGFSRARIATVKAMLAWIAALAGLALGTLLLLTGRGAAALGALVMFGPLIWSWWNGRDGAPPSQGGSGGRPGPPHRRGATMSRDEAYEVLGLRPGATDAEIRAAYVRLMRAIHPDSGGSDWLAARVNLARDTLLRR